ncbi:putative glycolipid-binding domain-containing protein [Agromyces bauzanensis]|uniref:Glycolipid-binding domain-containing protein n=2 Tax=Agromyces bauzanensis TaxID=1308924 RepID=A0A917PV56_9MICO|nr:hypothetical protein GCM10011372_34780 [Agromyces bauzanensis]
MIMSELVWRGVSVPSLERCRITEDASGVRIASTVEGESDCIYELSATVGWEFRSLVLRTDARTLVVTRANGEWSVDAAPRPDLVKAREVDISVSPLSNTLPIRRLALDVGQSAEIITAYVRVPELTVTVDPQRYTRLSADEYLYESLDSDFRRTITVDDGGLIVDYPGLFEREDPGTSTGRPSKGDRQSCGRQDG